MTPESMIWAAYGSIITIFITRLFDYLQQKQNHRYELKKIFFQKKVVAAEQAVSLWYSMCAIYTSLSALYEKFIALEENKATGSLFESMNNNLFAQLSKFQESSSQLANTVYLYFDLERDTSKTKEELKIFYDALVEIQDLKLSFEVMRDVKKEVNDPQAQEWFEEENKMLKIKSKEQLSRISFMLNKAQQKLNTMVTLLRSQMKEFDK